MSKASAAEVVTSVLTAAGIRRVISVDDNYHFLPEFADVSADVQLKEPSFLKQRLFPGLFSDDSAVLSDRLTKFWESSSDERKVEFLIAMELRNKGDVETTDAIALSKMPGLFASFDFRPMGLPEWRSKADELLEQCKKEKTLILFDEDLSKQDGTRDEGLKLLKEAFARTSETDLMACLVSHNYHLATLHDEWKRFTADHSLPQNRFSLIPKELLKDKQIEFAGLIKLTAVTKQYSELISQARNIFVDSVTAANERISEMTIVDLDTIIFQSSNREGVWEPDTLFRLLGIFHRGETRRRALLDGALRQASSEIRRISGIATPSQLRPSAELFRVQHMENYENAEQLNQLHRPTELGDIYEDLENRRRYILIAPQCDLMVRTVHGVRGDSIDILREGILAQIVSEKPAEGLGWKLDFYSEKDQFVDFKKTFMIRLIDLDLCVFNSDGIASFSINQEPAKLLIPAWERRHSFVGKYLAEIIDAYVRIAPQESQIEDINRLLTRSSNDSPFAGRLDPTAGRLEYNFGRVMRLLTPRATSLIGAYAKFLNRDAFQHKFS